jgi:phage portal protein BeeE
MSDALDQALAGFDAAAQLEHRSRQLVYRGRDPGPSLIELASRASAGSKVRPSEVGLGSLLADVAAQTTGPGVAGLGRSIALLQHAEQLRHLMGLVWSDVSAIAKVFSSQPFRVARIVSEPAAKARLAKDWSRQARNVPSPLRDKHYAAELEVLPSHPMYEVINRPNEVFTRSSLLSVHIAAKLCCGKAYWWIQEDDDAPNDAGFTIWPIPPSWMEPVHRPGVLYDHWLMRPEGTMQATPIPANEIAYDFYPDPSNPLGAISPLQALARFVTANEAISEAQRRGFLNDVWPGMGFVIGRHPDAKSIPGAKDERPMLDKAQRAQIMASIKQQWRGVQNFNEPLILDAFITDVIKLTRTNREMDFMNSGKYTQQQVDEGFCFAPGTLVWTENGVRPIESVQHGDVVLTHRGRWRPVVKTMSRHYDGPIRRLRFIGAPGVVEVTPEHPFLVGEQWMAAEDLRPTDGRVVGDRCAWPGLVGDETASPLVFRVARGRGYSVRWDSVEVPATESLAWAMGLYLAEGYRSATAIAFSGHVREVGHRRRRLAAAFREIAQVEPRVWRESAQGAAVVLTGKGLADWFGKQFGRSSKDKRIPGFVYRWPINLRRAFVAGYMSGDGSDSQSRGYDRAGYNTVSIQVAYGVRQLLRSLGFRAALKLSGPKGPRMIEGKLVEVCAAVYEGNVNGLTRPMIEAATPSSSRTSLTVRSNEEAVYSGRVYNIEVEEDHSYVLAAGPAVHNCVNPVIKGRVENVNRATAVAAKDLFFDIAVNPEIRTFSEWMTAKAAPAFGGSPVVAYLEEARAFDPDLQMERLKELRAAGAVSRNQERAVEGLPPMQGGDVCYVPATMVPVLCVSEGQEPDALSQELVEAAKQKPPAGGGGGGGGGPPEDPNADPAAGGADAGADDQDDEDGKAFDDPDAFSEWFAAEVH